MAFPQKDIDIDEINSQYIRLTEDKQKSDVDPNLDIHGSNITHPDEDAKNELQKQAIMELVNDQRQQREEIDGIKNNIQSLANKMGELVEGFNKMSELMANPQQMNQTQDQHAKFQMLTELFNSKIGDVILSRFTPQPQSEPLISNEEIQTKMKQTFYDNLETGESINNFIKNSLKKNVTKQIINTSLADIGKYNGSEHEPA